MARPRKSQATLATVAVKVRCTEEAYGALREKMEAHGYRSMSRYLSDSGLKSRRNAPSVLEQRILELRVHEALLLDEVQKKLVEICQTGDSGSMRGFAVARLLAEILASQIQGAEAQPQP